MVSCIFHRIKNVSNPKLVYPQVQNINTMDALRLICGSRTQS